MLLLLMRVVLIDLSPYMASVTPISLGCLGATVQQMGHEAHVVSLGYHSRYSVGTLRSLLHELAPRLVGFTTYQRNIFHVRAMALLVKEILPGCRVVLGGPQASFLPDAALKGMPEVDFVSRGEGELAIRAIIEALEAGTTQEPIPGVTSRMDRHTCLTGEAQPPPQDLDAFESPWLSGVLDPALRDETVMLTSRGCCNSCVFCITPAACGRINRCHSVDRVLEEIAWVAGRGNGRLWFADPNFSAETRRVVAILEGILSRNLEVDMWIETRADMLSGELIALMKRAGVRSVALGLESASERVFPQLNKQLQPEQVQSAAATALEAGLEVELFSQFGLPRERFDDAMQTLAFVKQCGVPIRGNSNAQQMQLYFGSEITANYHEYGLRPLRRDLPPHLSIGAQFETAWMSHEEIERVKQCWRSESLDGGKRHVS